MYKIRFASVADAAALLKIYTPFVTDTVVSFEYTAPTLEDFASRVANISAGYPYLVCECDGKIIGYAYAHAYGERAAYQWGAEASIYFAPEGQGKGLSNIIYLALEQLLALQGVRSLYACVTAENEHSVEFHHIMGYREIARFERAGYKLGRWLDMLWLGKTIGDFTGEPAPLVPFPKTDKDAAAKVMAAANAKLAEL